MTLECRMNQKEKWSEGSRNVRPISFTREKKHPIPSDSLLQEAIITPSPACFQRWPVSPLVSPHSVCKPLTHSQAGFISLSFNLGRPLALLAQICQKRIWNPDLQLATCTSFLVEHSFLELRHWVLRTSVQLHVRPIQKRIEVLGQQTNWAPSQHPAPTAGYVSEPPRSFHSYTALRGPQSQLPPLFAVSATMPSPFSLHDS